MVSRWSSVRLSVGPFVHPSYSHPSVFLFQDDNLSKCQCIFTKFGLCIDIVDIWFRISNGQISSIFEGVICLKHVKIFISGH